MRLRKLMYNQLVSIIIPVYNKEKYIEKCLTSIQHQSYRNIEVICVDDGSVDHSFEICSNFAREDKRLHVLHQENKGAAESRNIGLDIARGEYVTFLDADDTFDERMIEKACNEALHTGADVVVWGYKEIHINFQKLEVSKAFTSIDRIPEYDIVEHENVDFDVVEAARTVPWNKLVRKDLLVNKNIYFQNLPSENDVFYSNAVILSANKIAFIKETLVNYHCGLEGSISEQRIKKKSHALLAYNLLYQFIKMNENHLSVKYLDKILDWILGNITKDDNEVRIQSISDNYKECKELHKAFLDNQDNPAIKIRNRGLIRELSQKDIGHLSSNKYRYIMGFISEMVSNAHNENKKVALWGCGYQGKKLIDALEECNIKIDYVVDRDLSKQGSKYQSYVIQSYEEIGKKTDIIFITNPSFLNDIVMAAPDKEIINITEY